MALPVRPTGGGLPASPTSSPTPITSTPDEVEEDISLPDLDDDFALPNLEDVADRVDLDELALPEIEAEPTSEAPDNQESADSDDLDWDDIDFDTPLSIPENELEDSSEDPLADFIIDEPAETADDEVDDEFEKLMSELDELEPELEETKEFNELPSDDESGLDKYLITEEVNDSEDDNSENETEVIEENLDELALAPLKKEKSKKAKSKKKPKTGKSGYNKFATKIFSSLGKIPFIGKIFNPLIKVASVALTVLLLLPLLLIPLIVYNVAVNTVPNEAELLLPDNGSVIIANVNFDKSTQTANALITNTGDIIAEVTPEFTIWIYELGLNPATWVKFSPFDTCIGESTVVDIDTSVEVQVECSFDEIPGIEARASAELAY